MAAGANAYAETRFIQVAAKTKEERSAIVNMGMSIEATRSDSVWGFATDRAIARLEQSGHAILGNFDFKTGRGGHEGLFDFPPEDARFHNFDRTVQALKKMQAANADITALISIGKSVEGRDLWALHINSKKDELLSGTSTKPGAIFMGNHHAREHVSLEVPLMLAQYILDHRRDPQISKYIDTRDLWILPMINPDGADYDISTGTYQWWRKNRRDNGDGTFGVDLNRNYGYEWGTGGSDKETDSEIYMGPQPFSEPETQAVKDFVEAHLNAKVLLTFHTFSELILYPWGHTYDKIANTRDHDAFDKMAKTMAKWNGYTPEQASSLYIASGDTTDWAYGAHGIFAFTFELSPKDEMAGGFYPGAGAIDRVFNANLKPCLYLLDLADDPYKVLTDRPSGFLKSYVEPGLDELGNW
ncbi:MAG: M14 family metallopeptidase [Bdellovibrionota bacterium]